MSQEEVRRILNTLEPLIGKAKAERYWKAWLLEDREGREALQRDLEVVQERLAKQGYAQEGILLRPPARASVRGGIPVGRVQYNGKDLHAFGLHPDLLLRHVTIFGQSGSGKTNLGYVLLLELLKRHVPFLVLDWKRNYRDLKGFTQGQDVQVYTVGRKARPLSYNPLIPPKGIDAKVWLKKLVEIIGRAYYVGEGVISILHKGVDAVYRRAGVYERRDDEMLRWPTLRDVRDWIEWHVEKASAKELKAQWIASTLRTLQSLCFGDMDDILNDEIESTPLEHILDKPVVLELDGLTDNDKAFIIDSILLWIHHYRLQEPERERLKHVILIEEAHHVLRKKLATEKESIIDVLIREIRELGEGLIMISQSPGTFSQNAISNSNTSFVFNLKDRTDVLTASKFLLLEEDQQPYLHNLPVGHCIAKTSAAGPSPFLVHVPHVKIRKASITDEIIQHDDSTTSTGWKGILERMEHLNAVLKDVVKSEFFQTYSADSGTEEPALDEQGLFQGLPPSDKEGQVKMLADIAQYPMSGVHQRYKRLGVSTRHGNHLKNTLLKEGLVRIQELKTPEGHTIILELTDNGREALKESRPDLNAVQARNGAEHRYWKNRVGTGLARHGYGVEYEKSVDGGRADILVKNGDTHVVEIETGKSQLNKRRSGATSMTVIPTSRTARRRLRHQPPRADGPERSVN